jgi:hypothetical protein
VPTSTVSILAVAMTRTPQPPSIRRSPRHDKRKRRSESGVRMDKRKRSPTKATKKKRSNAKTTKDHAKGAKKRTYEDRNNPVFASSDDEEDEDNDAASSKSSGCDYKEDDLESFDKSSASCSPRMLKKKRKMKSDMTQQKKAMRPKKPAAVEGGRMPNYSEDEDYFIAVAFTNVTVDPIRGVGQKGENFWTRVHDKFCMLQQKELVESGQHIQVQTKDSIE